jgi:hypothetical protein
MEVNDVLPAPEATTARKVLLWLAVLGLSAISGAFTCALLIIVLLFLNDTSFGGLLALAVSLVLLAVAVMATNHAVRALNGSALSQAPAATAMVLGVGAGLVGAAAAAVFAIAGAAWGRPLRIRGRILYPELRQGSDWTKGASPSVEALSPDTRRALEALWLHDEKARERAGVLAHLVDALRGGRPRGAGRGGPQSGDGGD